jgi:hypothetical protein
MGLGIDLTLLAVDAEPGYLRVRPSLPYSLVVGELVDLAAAERIAVREDRLRVLDRSPIGDVLADAALLRLAEIKGPGLFVEEWVGREGRWRVEAYLAGLRYEHVLRESSVKVTGSGRIEIADTLRAAAPVRRLRALVDEESEPSSVRNLAFLVLAASTGWPQARLGHAAYRKRRTRLKRLTSSVTGTAVPPAYEGDPAFAVLRCGMRAAAKLARADLVSGRYIVADYSPAAELRSRKPGGPEGRRGLNLVIDVVALLAAATLVLACLANVDLAVIIAPFSIALIGVSVAAHVQRRESRRKADPPAPRERPS